ncbi:MAG TPA: hypothetical protein VLI05_01480 [Candidatus Saccharimonadia bacterium]|nr:hypothetical protein [Candidatus Saccharimonadia bacterium]
MKSTKRASNNLLLGGLVVAAVVVSASEMGLALEHRPHSDIAPLLSVVAVMALSHLNTADLSQRRARLVTVAVVIGATCAIVIAVADFLSA